MLGRITIGAGSVIGGNVWLTRSIPPDIRALQVVPEIAIEADELLKWNG